MLLSFVNMKLRDEYSNLEAMAEGLDISQDELKTIVDKLESIGYTYNSEQNKFA